MDRPAKGKGEGGRGTQGRGSYMSGQRGGDVREKGTLHRRSVALPSYKNQKPKVAQTHTWDSSKQRTHSSLPLNTFTNTPTTLNQTHVQYFQLKKSSSTPCQPFPAAKKNQKDTQPFITCYPTNLFLFLHSPPSPLHMTRTHTGLCAVAHCRSRGP